MDLVAGSGAVHHITNGLVHCNRETLVNLNAAAVRTEAALGGVALGRKPVPYSAAAGSL
jgi:hypothetical protein